MARSGNYGRKEYRSGLGVATNYTHLKCAIFTIKHIQYFIYWVRTR